MEKLTKPIELNTVDQDVTKNPTETPKKDTVQNSKEENLKNPSFSWLTEHSRNFLAAGSFTARETGLKAQH